MNFLNVLQKGNAVSNPSTYKIAQNRINLLSAIAPIITLVIPSTARYLTPELFIALTTALAGINTYLTTASTDKIGL